MSTGKPHTRRFERCRNVAIAVWNRLRECWLFRFRLHTVGVETAHETLIALLTLSIVTAASYALAMNEIPDAGLIAHGLYAVITIIVVWLTYLIISSPRYDATTFRFGQIIAWTALLLCIAFVGFGAGGIFPGQSPKRRSFTAAEVSIQSPSIASQYVPNVNPRGGFREGESEDAKLVDRFKTWFAATGTMDAAKQEVLIAEQYPGFDDDYNTFSAVMIFNPGAEFLDALVFLRRRLPIAGGSAVDYVPLSWRYGDMKDAVASEDLYQQLALPRSQSGQAYPVITIPNPDHGDSLLIFARFKAANNKSLVADAKWYTFKLRRSQR
jgi:hypothetical protein